jgi:hypothetical protein
MTTINKTNYFEEIKNIDIAKLPDALKEGFETIKFGTKDYTTWKFMEDDKEFLKVYFEKLNKHLTKADSKPASTKKPTSKAIKSRTSSKPKTSTKTKKQTKPKTTKVEMVEKVDDCVSFIKRYVNLQNKVKTKREVLLFINALQRAITEKKIRKTSTYAKEIRHIQDNLVKLYNSMKEQAKVEIKQSTYDSYYKIAYGQKVMLSVQFIKRFIGIQGKKDVKDKAKQLAKAMEKAVQKQQINRSDPNKAELEKIYTALRLYIEGKSKVLEIDKAELKGLGSLFNSQNPTPQKKK